MKHNVNSNRFRTTTHQFENHDRSLVERAKSMALSPVGKGILGALALAAVAPLAFYVKKQISQKSQSEQIEGVEPEGILIVETRLDGPIVDDQIGSLSP